MSNDLGLDRSGNGNNWTVNNITYADQMVDSPTNNFATIDPLSSGNGTGVISEGNLKYVTTAKTGVGTQGISSGKAYAEVTISSAANQYIGVCDISRGINPLRGGGWSDHGGIAYKFNGDQYKLAVGSNSSASASYGASYTNGDIIGIAIDVDNDTITFYKNGSSQGNTASGSSFLSSGGVYSIMIYGGSDMVFIVNFGQDSSFAGTKTAQGNQDSNDIGDFYYTPPTGFLALCTSNLPDVAVVPSEHFNTVIYSGNGSTQSITGLGFAPNFSWFKSRSNATSHNVYDSVRGGHKYLLPDLTAAEQTGANGFVSLDSDGFSLNNAGGGGEVNVSGRTYVAWNWKANGSGSSNSSGDITSTVSANTDAGFSIVKYTATGTTGHTVGHGLGAIPDAMLWKSLTTQSWNCFFPNTSMGATKGLQLDNTGAQGTVAHMNNTMPTSSVFSLGANGAASNAFADGVGQAYIVYCFKSIEGYSKFGSYIGNGNNDGVYVHLGFRPMFVIAKVATAGTHGWGMYNSKSKTYNYLGNVLQANGTNAEMTSEFLDFTSNGFKHRTSSTWNNGANQTYIYMAFAETPAKYSNAR